VTDARQIPAVHCQELEPGEGRDAQRLEKLELGQNPDGRIDIASRVIEKIAARAALEVDDAGGAGVRVLGRNVPGAGRLGIPGAGLDELPAVTALVDGRLAFVDLELSFDGPLPR
jgi:hypothetical protein